MTQLIPINNKLEANNNFLPTAVVHSTSAAGFCTKKVGSGSLATRIDVGLIGDFTKVQIQEIQKGQEDQVLYALRHSWFDKRNWAPLKIKDQNGLIRTVLVKVDSLKDKLGISKRISRSMVFADDNSPGLAAMINQIKRISSQFNDVTTAMRVVNFVELQRIKAESELKNCDSVTYDVTQIPFQVTFFKDRKIHIHMRQLGTGGFKNVTGVLDYDNNVKMAMGQLKHSENRNYFRQVDALAFEGDIHLKYPNVRGIVKTYEVRAMTVCYKGVKRSEPVIMQAWYPHTLLDYKGLTLKELKKAMLDTAMGLAYLHGDGRVHRDIKPANMLVDHDPNGEIIVDLADLGVSNILGDETFQKQRGTSAYMAPEILANDLKKTLEALKKGDVWSLGCAWYYMHKGDAPYWVKDNKVFKKPVGEKANSPAIHYVKESADTMVVQQSTFLSTLDSVIIHAAQPSGNSVVEVPILKKYTIQDPDSPEAQEFNKKLAADFPSDSQTDRLMRGMLNLDADKRFSIQNVLDILLEPDHKPATAAAAQSQATK